MIGHLQTNKAKLIAPFITSIDSVDSFKLIEEINKQAHNCNRIIDCLLQIHIADEETKFGFTVDEASALLRTEKLKGMQHILICGLMGIATNIQDEAKISAEFSSLTKAFQQFKAEFFRNKYYFKRLSMGMSTDYKIAVRLDATEVRLGSIIFGERQYPTN